MGWPFLRLGFLLNHMEFTILMNVGPFHIRFERRSVVFYILIQILKEQSVGNNAKILIRHSDLQHLISGSVLFAYVKVIYQAIYTPVSYTNIDYMESYHLKEE